LAYIGNKPANKAIVASDLDPAVITGQTALAVAPADTDEFLISDAGTLKRIDASLVIPSGGLEVADQWRLTTSLAVADAFLTANLEQVDTAPQGSLGSAMTQSSGVFTFPSTGFYWVKANAQFKHDANTRQAQFGIYGTANNSSYVELSLQHSYITIGTSGNTTTSLVTDTLIDVTDVSTHKVKFYMAGIGGGEDLIGSSSKNSTYFTFFKLGAT